ncbi:MAG: hypothetical protein K9N11_03030 [Lentisphaeria bacterium]|nr:hypothetical protein [Candidatus Neomarinimicrobiota bacterium]MCF7841806.1 hypothetical protein [Lentisphaeria bacterium]
MISLPCSGQVLMTTSGNITLQSYFHGFPDRGGISGGYRSDFTGYADIYRMRRLVVYTTLGTTTEISQTNPGIWRLDRIWYSLAPAIRLEYKDWLVSGIIHHDCIHRLNLNEINGSTWWNAFQLVIGTRESTSLYILDYYQADAEEYLRRLDGSLTLSRFIKAEGTVLDGRNHNYQYYGKIRLRYPLYSSKRWFSYINTDQQWWVNLDQSTEYKSQFSFHLILKGMVNSLGFYYIYTPEDTFSKDSEDRLGALGIRILF